jgi:hypothetical protein
VAREDRLAAITKVMASVFIEELGRAGGLLDQDDDAMRAGIERLVRDAILAARVGGAS